MHTTLIRTLIVSFFFVISIPAIAEESLTIFQAGTLIKAEEVNANFTLLQQSIVELEQELATLKESQNPEIVVFTHTMHPSETICAPRARTIDASICDEYSYPLGYYLDHESINNNPDAQIVINKDLSRSTFPQEVLESPLYFFRDLFAPNGAERSFSTVDYDTETGKWYIMLDYEGTNGGVLNNIGRCAENNEDICTTLAFNVLVVTNK